MPYAPRQWQCSDNDENNNKGLRELTAVRVAWR